MWASKKVWQNTNSQVGAPLREVFERLIWSPSLTQSLKVMVLADTAFGSVQFLKARRKRRYQVMAGVRYDGNLADEFVS